MVPVIDSGLLPVGTVTILGDNGRSTPTFQMAEPLYQIMGRHRREPLPERKPSWLKVKAPGGANYMRLKGLMRELDLHTVCEESALPQRGRVLGARYGDVHDSWGRLHQKLCLLRGVTWAPPQIRHRRACRAASAIAQMNLRHAVITSVDRDDLPDFGSYISPKRSVRFISRPRDVRLRCWCLISRERRRDSLRARRASRDLQSQHRNGPAAL